MKKEDVVIVRKTETKKNGWVKILVFLRDYEASKSKGLKWKLFLQ